MSSRRLKARLPSTRFFSTASLSDHRLVFHKQSIDGSAKCDAWHSQNINDSVHGVVFHIDANEKPMLDSIEGAGYGQKQVKLQLPDGSEIQAYTYFAIDIATRIKPYSWYLEHVLRGADEHNLPKQYINEIKLHGSIEDPDRTRHRRELSIY